MWDTLKPKLSNGLNDIANLLGDWANQHLINILVILLGAWLLRHFGAGVISRLLHHTIRTDLYPTKTDREKRIKTLNSLVRAMMGVGVYVIAFILIIGEINPSYTTALFASAGLISVALGFGAQSLIKDFVSGIFIITENQYRVGDFVELGSVSGTVEALTIRTTIVRDLDGNLHHVPNGTITVTTNKSIAFGQLNEDIVVAPDTNLEELEHVISHVGEQLAAVPGMRHKLHSAPRVASIKGFHEKGLIVKVVARTSPGEQGEVRSEFYRLIKTAFEKHKIEARLSQKSLEI